MAQYEHANMEQFPKQRETFREEQIKVLEERIASEVSRARGIVDELRALTPQLTAQEKHQLEQNLINAIEERLAEWNTYQETKVRPMFNSWRLGGLLASGGLLMIGGAPGAVAAFLITITSGMTAIEYWQKFIVLARADAAKASVTRVLHTK